MKLLIPLLTLIFCSFTALSQKKITLGVMGGPNYCTLQETNAPDAPEFIRNFNARTRWLGGLQAGMYATYHFSSRFAFSANGLYAQKGYRVSTPLLTDRENDTLVRSHYLSFPTLARYYPGERLYLEIGMEASLLLATTSRFVDKEIDLNKLVGFKGTDFGYTAGLGFNIVNRLCLQVRYIRGLANVLREVQFIDENGEPLDAKAPKIQTHSVQFSLAMDLPE